MNRVPDAWDDEWEAIADSSAIQPEPAEPRYMSRAERKALHDEENKRLWESAERQGQPTNPFDLLKVRHDVPLATGFKPAIAVLARKPKPIDRAKRAMNGVSLMDEDDSEEEARKKSVAELARRQEEAKLEREEKQRKYAEVRERLFGPGSGSSQEAPNTDAGRKTAQRRPRSQNQNGSRSSQTASPMSQSENRPPADPSRKLFDPIGSSSPRSLSEKDRPARAATPNISLIKPFRQPTGPDGSGPHGHGFGPRQT